MNKWRKKSPVNFCISLIFLCVFFIFHPGYAFEDSYSSQGLNIYTEGARIDYIKKDLIKTKILSPLSSIKITNYSGSRQKILLKIDNINLSKYKITSLQTILQKEWGKRYVTLQFWQNSGETVNIKITPRLKNPGEFTFAILGDSHGDTKIHKKILQKISKTNAIFAINMGDITQNGTISDFEKFNRNISSFPLPYFIVIGNHERYEEGSGERFVKYIGPLDYSFRCGNFNFIILNNSRGRITPSRFDWLKNQLQQHKNNLVFIHVPCVSPNPLFDDFKMHSQEECRNFMQLMKRHKTKAVFAGHIHGYNKKSIMGTQYIISGCAGACPYMLPFDGGFHHFILVHIKGNKFTTEVFKVNP